VFPIIAIVGFVDIPVVPKDAWLKDNLPLIPTPPATCNAPVAVDVEAVVDVIANPEVDSTFVEGL
jgi:hypothetical protein